MTEVSIFTNSCKKIDFKSILKYLRCFFLYFSKTNIHVTMFYSLVKFTNDLKADIFVKISMKANVLILIYYDKGMHKN